MNKHFYFLCSFLFFIQSSSANIAEEMNKIISNASGNFSNYSSGGAYKDQMGGHYTGGSLYVRTPAHNVQPVNIQMPSLRSGCGGIDAYTGGFSYINSKHLIGAMQDVASKAISYGFTLALDQTSPMISNAIKYLHSSAQKMNEMNINSCEAGATLAGSIWPKTEASNRLLCSQMGTRLGKFSDFAQARQGCSDEHFDEVMAMKNKSEFKDMLGSEFNLAWKALTSNGFFKGDPFLSRFMMTVSGTIVSRKVKGADNKFEITHYHSRALDGNLLDTLVNGGTSSIYRCDEDEECLIVSEEQFSVKQGHETLEKERALKGLVVKINETLNSVSLKLRDEDAGSSQTLTEEEKGLINSTSIPIMKIIDVQMAFRRDKSAISWSEYTDAIAYDIVLGYMEHCSDIILAHLHHIKNAQINAETAKDFRQELLSVKHHISTKRHSILERINALLSIKEKTQMIERQLFNYFDNASNITEDL